MTPESRIAASIMRWLRTLPQTVAWKISDFNNVGFPDIAGAHRGVAFWFEVKARKGRVSKKQAYEIDKIRTAGGRVDVVWSLDEAQKTFRIWFGAARRG